MNPPAEDGGFESAGYLREYARGKVDSDPDVHVHAGLVRNDKARRWLSWLADAYTPVTDDMPASFWETEFARRAMRKHGTETAHYAVEHGLMHVIDYLTGLPDASVDVSTIDTLDWLEDWVSRDAAITLLSGHMNSGKTAFALLLAELWLRVYQDGHVLSNIRTCPQTESCSRMSKLVDHVLDHPDEPTLFVFDEAAAHASGDLDDYELKEQMRQLIRFSAKFSVDIVVIGHAEGGADISPEVRRFAHAVEKTTKKRATIYENIEGREYVDKLKELKGVPDTSWDYDPDEPATWRWDWDGDDLVDLGRDVDDIDWGEGVEDVGDEGEDEPEFEQCRGWAKTRGERCGQTNPAALDEHGYCRHHASQHDPNADRPAYQRLGDTGEGDSPHREPPANQDTEAESDGANPTPEADESRDSDGDDGEITESDVVGTNRLRRLE